MDRQLIRRNDSCRVVEGTPDACHYRRLLGGSLGLIMVTLKDKSFILISDHREMREAREESDITYQGGHYRVQGLEHLLDRWRVVPGQADQLFYVAESRAEKSKAVRGE